MKDNSNNIALSVSEFKKKKRKYAYTSITSTALIIVAVVIFNFIVSILGTKVNLKTDLTKDGILEFSEETDQIINNLKMDVTITSLVPASNNDREMLQVDEILKKYDQASDKITYKRVDAARNPGYLTKYTRNGQPLDSSYYIIFESSRMYHVVSVNDLLSGYSNQSTKMSGEHFFSNALVKVTEGSDVNVAVTQGHGEKYTADNFRLDIFSGSGYNFKDISLVSEDIPEGTDVIIIASPKNDYSTEEIAKLDTFSRNGGHIQIIADVDTVVPNLSGYMAEWGVSLEDGVIGEDSTSNYAQYKTSIIADIPENEITGTFGLEGKAVLFPYARPVNSREVVGVTTTVIASTSKNAYVKKHISDMNIINEFYENGDLRKQSNLAVVATRQNAGNSVSHMSVIGTSWFVSDVSKNFDILDSGAANRQFLTQLMNYVTDQANVPIMYKDIAEGEVIINQMNVYIYMLITVVVIPLVIISWGIITWIRRRHS